MTNSKFISFQGEDYRDDRIFVMDIVKGEITYVKKEDGQIKQNVEECWFVVTYRNTAELPQRNSLWFENKEAAENYVKEQEPFVGLISLQGKHLKYEEGTDVWDCWTEFLKSHELHSAMSGYHVIPYSFHSEGGSFTTEKDFKHTAVDPELAKERYPWLLQ